MLILEFSGANERDLVVIANLYLPGFRVPISIDTFVGCESANRDHLYTEYKK